MLRPRDLYNSEAQTACRVGSTSIQGFSTVHVELDRGMDIYRARQIVSEKLQTLEWSFPDEVDRLIMALVTSLRDLRTPADFTIRKRLLPRLASLLHDKVLAARIPITEPPDFERYEGLLKCRDVTLTPDTGPMHIAEAVGTSVDALFSSWMPDECGPLVPKDRYSIICMISNRLSLTFSLPRHTLFPIRRRQWGGWRHTDSWYRRL